VQTCVFCSGRPPHWTAIGLIGLALLTACTINGNAQTYPGASVYQAPGGKFHFHFLAPPWRYKPKEAKHLVYLVVDSTSQFKRSGDISINHKLWISYDPGTRPETVVSDLRDKAVAAGKTLHRDLESFNTLTGEQGYQYMAYKDDAKTGDRYDYRDVTFTDIDGHVVLFAMVAAYSLWDQDMDDVILSYSAGPDTDDTESPSRRFDGLPLFLDSGTP